MLQLDPLLGPLAPLVGSWEGGAGLDLAPDEDDRRSTATSKFREVMTFEPLGLVDNHQQSLYGLRYTTFAWRIDEPEPFHQELGYWLWDADAKLIMRCFTIPRGVALLAGGHAEPDARRFELAAALGSTTFGISSNPYLDREFRTLRFSMRLVLIDDDCFAYDEDTELEILGQPLFHHTDANTLRRTSRS